MTLPDIPRGPFRLLMGALIASVFIVLFGEPLVIVAAEMLQ